MAVVRLYETLFLLDATKVAADADAARAQIQHILDRSGCEVVVARPWDENRKLAYPIKKQKKGYYYAVYYKADTAKQPDLERDIKLSELVLRHLTSAVDPKWEEAVMDVAKNDHAIAFALRGMHEDASSTDLMGSLGGGVPSMGDGGGDGGDRPRGPRGPRREYAEKPE